MYIYNLLNEVDDSTAVIECINYKESIINDNRIARGVYIRIMGEYQKKLTPN